MSIPIGQRILYRKGVEETSFLKGLAGNFVCNKGNRFQPSGLGGNQEGNQNIPTIGGTIMEGMWMIWMNENKIAKNDYDLSFVQRRY